MLHLRLLSCRVMHKLFSIHLPHFIVHRLITRGIQYSVRLGGNNTSEKKNGDITKCTKFAELFAKEAELAGRRQNLRLNSKKLLE